MDELPKPVAGFLPQVRRDRRDEQCKAHGPYVSEGYSLGKHMHWTNCPACSKFNREREEAAAMENKAAEEQDRFEARMKRSGIPIRFRSKDFASFTAETDQQEKARAVAMEFAQNFDRHMALGTTMVFSGQPGTGKSHLAIAIAQEVMVRRTALYISAIDAVRMVRDTWRKGSEKTEIEVLDMLASIHLLVLDEVGVQYGTEAEQITLFDIIDKRYRDMKPTILLTNQNKAGMKEFLGDRSFDRLREGGIWVTFDWKSQRGSQ